jgi:SAM-dependent methyltransferase
MFKSFIRAILPSVGRKNDSNRKIWVEKILHNIPTGQRILDAGAGQLQYKPFCSHLNYVSQDFGQYDGKGDGQGLQTGNWDQSKIDIICDIADIPEPDNSFDAILCVEVFEHLPNPVLAIKEFSRLLCSGGKLIITAPFCSLTHFAPFHFSSGFNIYWYEKYFQDYGFKMLEIKRNGNFFEYLAQELWRLNSVVKKYTRKKFTLFHWVALLQLLQFLEKCSRNDSGSDELLCFGYHIYAEKI